MKNVLLVSLFLCLVSCGFLKKPEGPRPLPSDLAEAIDSDDRSEDNKERDSYQHPRETLEFFGVRPDMSIMEINPGEGYYTEILAPYLTREGQFYMAVPRMSVKASPSQIASERKLQDFLLRHSDVKAKSRFVPFEPIGSRDLVKKNAMDMVIVHSRFHNWMASKSVPMGLKFVHDVLKPGGVFGIIQHRLPENMKLSWKTGYLKESEVIAQVKRAGFKFIGSSPVNENKADTHDHPGGVWALPPTYRWGMKDKSKYRRIGESDRMTLKFVK